MWEMLLIGLTGMSMRVLILVCVEVSVGEVEI